jgi:hypothetical protein
VVEKQRNPGEHSTNRTGINGPAYVFELSLRYRCQNEQMVRNNLRSLPVCERVQCPSELVRSFMSDNRIPKDEPDRGVIPQTWANGRDAEH